MEAVHWVDRQASLPKLKIAEEISRRDSIASSRTGDSGYISDPDLSLSPLEFVAHDKRLLELQVPETNLALAQLTNGALLSQSPQDILNSVDKAAVPLTGPRRSVLLRRLKEVNKIGLVKPPVTSHPGPFLDAEDEETTLEKEDWTHAFKDTADLSRNDDVALWIDESMPANNRPKERVASVASISTNASGSNYTITDDNSEEETWTNMESSTLSKATLTTIELVLRKIEVNLRYAAYMQCAGGQSSRRQSGSGEVSRAGRGPNQSSSAKRKSRDDPPGGDPDDDGANKRRRGSATTLTDDSEAGPRFACPFFKHDPNRYRNRRTCPGPGWPTVHRMKEHLYRSHAQPICCPRCYIMFDSDNELSNHLRTRPCEIAEPQPIEGIDRETLNALRRRSPALRLEEDKWRDAYKLLFPQVPEADIPSPYYDSNSPTEESRRFRRELLERIRRELFATAEQEAGPVEQGLLRQVAEIIRRCETELLDAFYGTSAQHVAANASLSQPPETPTTAPIPLSRPAPPASHHQQPAPVSRDSLRPDAALHMPRGLPDAAQYPNDAPMDFPAGWDDSFQWIDWNAVFPPGPELQAAERNEPAPLLSTPVWS
ncbi:hypothetical protein BDV96DRAFT_360518 [Lophiotrema nucula]|uniref:C2H2-type domain-containing protein n=1 Tax=Lophiotrema nucula TaxID=690887 RepID=A0A6A5ZGM1_9PLEO|nr:hypothetical protein BDV96DRAFT_360518 [Lophiotrema nucula]